MIIITGSVGGELMMINSALFSLSALTAPGVTDATLSSDTCYSEHQGSHKKIFIIRKYYKSKNISRKYFCLQSSFWKVNNFLP